MSIRLQDGIYIKAPFVGDQKTIVGTGTLFLTKDDIPIQYRANGMPVYELGTKDSYRWDAPNSQWTLETVDLTGYVPYTGATSNVNLGEFGILAKTVNTATFWKAIIGEGEYAGPVYAWGNENTLSSMLEGWNIAIGDDAMKNSVYAYENVIIGDKAGENFEGTYSAILGNSAGRFADSDFTSIFGSFAGEEYVGTGSVLFGLSAGRFSTGDNVTAIGGWAADYSDGERCGYIGYQSGRFSIGTRNTGIGAFTLGRTIGDYNTGVGYEAMQSPIGDSNTGIGAYAGSDFGSISGAEKGYLPEDVDVAGNLINIPAHGFGVAGQLINVKYICSGTTIGSTFTSGQIERFEVVDDDNIKDPYDGITRQGTGTTTLYPQNAFSNVTCIGYRAQPSKSNQITLGNSAVTEVRLGNGDILYPFNTGNFVTIDTEQTITGDKTFTQPITVKLGLAGIPNVAYGADSILFSSTAGGLGTISYPNTTQALNINFPDASGTLALTSDITTPDLSNYVTLDGDETITGAKTFTEDIVAKTINSLALFQQGTGSSSSIGIGNFALVSQSAAYVIGVGYQAAEHNTGVLANGVGYKALRLNKGGQSNGMGARSLENNTGGSSNGFGGSTLTNNTGESATGVGDAALYANSGNSSSGVGYNALSYNKGVDASGLGAYALRYNTGAYCIGVGRDSGTYNQGYNNVFIGYQSGYETTPDMTTAKEILDASTDVNTAQNRITIVGHGFGNTGDYVNLRYNTTGDPMAGTSNDKDYQFDIVDANTLHFSDVYINSIGSGTQTLTAHEIHNNTFLLGTNTKSTKSNQIVLGDANVTEVVMGNGDVIYPTSVSGNYVTLDTVQTITGAKTFSNKIYLTNTIDNAIEAIGVPGKSGITLDMDGFVSDLVEGTGMRVVGGSGTLGGSIVQVDLTVVRNADFSTQPYTHFGLKSKNKNNIELRAITAAEGASHINSRLQVGYDQWVTDLANPYTLAVDGTGHFTGNVSATNLSGTNTGDQTLSGLGGIGGSGSTNYIPKFTGGNTIGNSIITDDGAIVNIGGLLRSGGYQIQGAVDPPNGVGLEIVYDTNNDQGIVQAYNRDLGAWKNVVMRGSKVTLIGFTNGVDINGVLDAESAIFSGDVTATDFILSGGAVAAQVPTLNQTVIDQQAEIQTLKAALIQANTQIDLIRTHLGI